MKKSRQLKRHGHGQELALSGNLLLGLRLALNILNEHQEDGFTLAAHSRNATAALIALTQLHAAFYGTGKIEDAMISIKAAVR